MIDIATQHETPAAISMPVIDAIRGRRSIGKVQPERPSREAIDLILEAGTWAPCHHVTEPWKFVVIAGDLYDGDWRDYRTGRFFNARRA